MNNKCLEKEGSCLECENCFTCQVVGNIDNKNLPNTPIEEGSCLECENCFTCQVVGNAGSDITKGDNQFMPCNSFTIFSSEGCNLDCEYCFFRGQHNKKNMSEEVGLKVMDFAFLVSNSQQPLTTWFFGGEPLLNYKVIKKMVEKGKKISKKTGRQYNFGATTNATLINEEIFTWWKEQGGNFLFSIDGCEEGHDLNRKHIDGSGSFQEAWQWVSKWLKHKPDTSIRYTVHPSVLDYQVKGLKFLVENGATIIAICPDQECDWTEDNLKRYKDNLLEISEYMIEQLEQEKLLKIKPIDDGISLYRTTSRIAGGRCGTGSGDIGVGVDGKFYLCHRFVLRDLESIGNVNEGFNTNRPLNFDIGKVKGLNCDKCHIKNRCNGWCIAVNYDKMGSIYEVPEVVCRLEYIHQEVADRLLHRLRGTKYYNQVLGVKGQCLK